MNINTELFKRYTPSKKLQIVQNLTDEELKLIRISTILRCVKEAGSNYRKGSKFKTLYLSERPGNNWNSDIRSVSIGHRGSLYMTVYIQGDDTDTNDTCDVAEFINWRYNTIECGTLSESFSNGYSHIVPANYDVTDRLRVLKSILKQYVITKYNITD